RASLPHCMRVLRLLWCKEGIFRFGSRYGKQKRLVLLGNQQFGCSYGNLRWAIAVSSCSPGNWSTRTLLGIFPCLEPLRWRLDEDSHRALELMGWHLGLARDGVERCTAQEP